MSTIFGLYLQDKKEVYQHTADKMMAVMNHWNADDSGFLLESNLLMGNLMLHNTPESLYEKLPLKYEQYWITSDARIDNRSEIIQVLKEFRHISEKSPDSTLILFLYIKFGKNCVDHIIGDFAFSIWNSEKSEIFCARDQMGVKPFFYYSEDYVFAFASEVKGILAVDGVNATLNHEFILRLIGDSATQPTDTFHQNIHILMPGHYMIVRPDNITIHKYWNLTIPPLLKLASPDDYIEAFKDQMDIAVKCRLRSVFPIASELSGGLDSSGITALAARLIDDKNRLYSFSYTMPSDENGYKEYDDEEIYIDEVIRFCAIQNPVKVNRSDWNSILEPHELEFFVNSGVGSYSAYWQEPLRRIMQEKSIRVTLSGFGGDELITNKGDYYFIDFLYEKEYADFVFASFKKGNYSLPLKMLLRYLAPAKVYEILNKDHRLKTKRNSFLLDYEFENKLITEDNQLSKISSRRYKEFLATKYEVFNTFLRFQSESSFSIMHKLEPRFPFIDIRLTSFFLSLPTSVIGHPFINRYMYRKSMEGIIPDLVRLRNDKTRAAAGVFMLKENRLNAKALMDWINKIDVPVSDNYLNKINLMKLSSGYDPENAENILNKKFIPQRPFKIECLVKYFEKYELQKNIIYK